MSYLLTGLAICVILAGTGAAMWGITMVVADEIDGPPLRRWLTLAAAITWFICGFAAIAYAIDHDDDQGPCLRQAVATDYDPATKMPRTYTYCAERGTWNTEH